MWPAAGSVALVCPWSLLVPGHWPSNVKVSSCGSSAIASCPEISSLTASQRPPFVHSHNLSYHDLLLEQSSVQLVNVIPWRQHRGDKEMIHGLYKLYRWMRDRCTNSCCSQPEPNHAWGSDWLIYGKHCLGSPAGPGGPQGQISHYFVLGQSYTHTQCVCARCPRMEISPLRAGQSSPNWQLARDLPTDSWPQISSLARAPKSDYLDHPR